MNQSNTNIQLEALNEFARKHSDLVDHCDTEEQTKISLINPFVELLGYNVRDPREVRYEYSVDVRLAKEKVDVALFTDDKPTIFIEAKSANRNLNQDSILNQIKSYAFQTLSVKFIALTNGVEWKWYKKKENPDPDAPKLEETPFLVHNSLDPTEKEIPFLRSIFSGVQNFSHAYKLANSARLELKLTNWLGEQKHEDTLHEDFVVFLTKRFMNKNSLSNRKIIKPIWLNVINQSSVAFEKTAVEHQHLIRRDESNIGSISSDTTEGVESNRQVNIENKSSGEKEFNTENGTVILNSSKKKRAWKPRSSDVWHIENNGSDLLCSVIIYFANIHQYGNSEFYDKIRREEDGYIDLEATSSFNFQRTLELGYVVNSNLSNPGKKKVLSRIAKCVVRGNSRCELEDLIDIWIP